MILGRPSGAALAGFTLLARLAAPGAAGVMELIEPPELAAAVADNGLPPVRERIPETPAVADMSGEGRRGGSTSLSALPRPRDRLRRVRCG